MSETIIQVENLSKMYRLGTMGTGSMKKDMHRWWTTHILKKEDPFLKDLTVESSASKSGKDILWALKDVNFDVKRGEVLGVVGSNGSGKSTLLKILSRIVRPTSGTVRGKGKVNSLLEIGTGFNPELTGRENIYMSGYFLGMKKQEIQKRFDEIVAFSGVEQFMDTPVKRYSSGMYMRLAFAVAAHLEPDILIIDEVLAVGDAEFQSKCLAKMQEVSATNGRTILFVSHDVQSVANLCTKAIWLDRGRVHDMGETVAVINAYLASFQQNEHEQNWHDPKSAPGTDSFKIKSIEVSPRGSSTSGVITVHTPVQVSFEFYNFIEEGNLEISVKLSTEEGICVFDLGSPVIKAEKKILAFEMTIPGDFLNDTSYLISLVILKDSYHTLYEFADCATFEVQDLRKGMHFFGSWPGVVRPKVEMDFYAKAPIERNYV